MTSKAALLLALLAAPLAAGGCRSDGGFDRIDCQQGLDFTTRCLVTQTHADVAATRAWFSSIPSAFARHTAESAAALRNTCQLYLDAHDAR